MTTAPKYPLEHAHLGDENPFDIVPTRWGSIERWRATALETGQLGAMTVLNKQIRDDAITRLDAIEAREAQLNARDDAISARERAHAVDVTNFTDFVGRAATLLDRVQKMRADAEAQAEPLAQPPGSPVPGSDDTPAHTPSGELHAIAPKDPEQGHPAAAADHIPAGGALHLKTPIPIPSAKDEAEFPDPELPHPPVTAHTPGLDEEA
jgi:hypothetical protein